MAALGSEYTEEFSDTVNVLAEIEEPSIPRTRPTHHGGRCWGCNGLCEIMVNCDGRPHPCRGPELVPCERPCGLPEGHESIHDCGRHNMTSLACGGLQQVQAHRAEVRAKLKESKAQNAAQLKDQADEKAVQKDLNAAAGEIHVN